MSKDWLFKTGEYTCHLRTVGVLVKDGKVLVQRERDGEEYALPGGTVKTGETTQETLIREFKEETGADIRIQKLLWTEETFWEWNGNKVHGIEFYYLAEAVAGCEISDNGEFVSQKDNCNVLLGWMPIEELKNITIYPEFVKEEIVYLNGPSKHFVSR